MIRERRVGGALEDDLESASQIGEIRRHSAGVLRQYTSGGLHNGVRGGPSAEFRRSTPVLHRETSNGHGMSAGSPLVVRWQLAGGPLVN